MIPSNFLRVRLAISRGSARASFSINQGAARFPNGAFPEGRRACSRPSCSHDGGSWVASFHAPEQYVGEVGAKFRAGPWRKVGRCAFERRRVEAKGGRFLLGASFGFLRPELSGLSRALNSSQVSRPLPHGRNNVVRA